MLISAPEYLERLARRGLLDERAPLAEHNAAVWRAWLSRHAELAAPTDALPVLLTPGGLGFYRDPLNDTGRWEWALHGGLSHGLLPAGAAEVIAAAEALPAVCAEAGLGAPTTLTDSFGLARPPDPEQARHFLWLRSPRARARGDFATYLSTLTHDRRRRVRTLLRRLDELPGLELDLSPRPLAGAELDFLVEQQRARWGADAAYALAQWAWALAVSEGLPGAALFLRARWRGELALLAAWVLRGEAAICQATCRREVEALSGLGGYVDLWLLRRLREAGGPVEVVDPTCRTGVEDTPDIWVSKRRMVNEEARWPTLIVGPVAPALPELEGEPPRYDPRTGWVLPPEPAVIGLPP